MLTQAPPEDRQLGPLVVHARSRADARRDIVGAVLHKEPLRVAFANVHLLYCALRDPSFASQLRDFYLVNDGVGIALLARLACGRGFRTNLNGTDLTPHVLAALPWGTRVMLVGARAEVVTHAAHLAAQHWPQLDICGSWDGFDGREQALAELNARAPDLVLVGMGNPLQEQWIARAVAERPNAVFLGVGALFDFIAGAVPRAPVAWRQLRLEWAFRLLQEPNRLWRRYTVEVLVVLMALLAGPSKRSA